MAYEANSEKTQELLWQNQTGQGEESVSRVRDLCATWDRKLWEMKQ